MTGSHQVRLPWRPARLVVALLLGNAIVLAQQAPVFRTRTDVVPVLVAVTTPAGEPVLDLTSDDFEVLDNGKRADLVAFGAQATPLAIALLVGHSPRMDKHAAAVRNAVHHLIDGLAAGEQMAIGGLRLQGYSAIAPFTGDRSELRADFDAVFQRMTFEPVGWWFAFTQASRGLQVPADFVLPSYTYLRPGQAIWSNGQLPAVKAIVVMSPGMDVGADSFGIDGYYSDKAARRALLEGTIVYGIGFNGKGGDKRLMKLAPQTSGWFVEPSKTVPLAAEVTRILTDLRRRYLLGFVPVVFDDEEHTLSVKVRRPGVVVRAKTAYLAPKTQ